MAEDDRLARLLQLADALRRAGLSHAVIGGVAMVAWSARQEADDLDIVVTPGCIRGRGTPHKLARVLSAYATASGVPPFVPDAAAFMNGGEIGIETALGHLDVIGASLPDMVDRERIIRRAVTRRVRGWRIKVCRLDDLVEIKSQTGRPKDSLDLALLKPVR